MRYEKPARVPATPGQCQATVILGRGIQKPTYRVLLVLCSESLRCGSHPTKIHAGTLANLLPNGRLNSGDIRDGCVEARHCERYREDRTIPRGLASDHKKEPMLEVLPRCAPIEAAGMEGVLRVSPWASRLLAFHFSPHALALPGGRCERSFP